MERRYNNRIEGEVSDLIMGFDVQVIILKVWF